MADGPREVAAGAGGSEARGAPAAPPAAADEPRALEAEPAPRGGAGAPPPPRGARPVRRAPAFALAVAADVVQWALLPLFLAGALSPWDEILDVLVGLALVRLVGWHWAFLPAFVAELVPGVDLVPSWTLAVWIATHGRR